MKFLTRINRNYLILFALILAGVTVAGYLILHIIIIRDVKENLLTKFQIEQDFQIKLNEQLAELLISNLLSNAINHNIKGGRISILMHSASLRICNTGEDNSLTNETIFNRFVTGNPKSYGLGLAIVRKICETNNLEINYYKDELHCFVLKIKS